MPSAEASACAAERNGPSAITSVTHVLLRKSLRATRSMARGAAWAATRLLGAQRPPNGFTIQVKTHGGPVPRAGCGVAPGPRLGGMAVRGAPCD